MYNHYVGTVEMEAKCMVDMIKQHIIPSCKAADMAVHELEGGVASVQAGLHAIHTAADEEAKAKAARVLRLETMMDVRKLCDKAEEDVPAVGGAATARRRRTRRRPAFVRGRGGRDRGRRSKHKGFGGLRRMRDSGKTSTKSWSPRHQAGESTFTRSQLSRTSDAGPSTTPLMLFSSSKIGKLLNRTRAPFVFTALTRAIYALVEQETTEGEACGRAGGEACLRAGAGTGGTERS